MILPLEKYKKNNSASLIKYATHGTVRISFQLFVFVSEVEGGGEGEENTQRNRTVMHQSKSRTLPLVTS